MVKHMGGLVCRLARWRCLWTVVTQFEIGAHVLTAGCPLNTQAMRAYEQRNSN
jgi:hypothetical protein